MKINMIRLKILLFVFIFIFISGCSSDDGENGDYSTVSNMIADRNKARLERSASERSRKGSSSNRASDSEDISQTQSETKKSPVMTFEEEVIIVSESTGKTISRGTAYLDKTGRIINIRISNR